MKYEKGDKVVVEITEADEKDKELTYGVGNPTWIRNEYILGKLEDFTKPKKIKMTEAEKKEFDKLKKTGKTLYFAFDEIASGGYPYLFNLVFGSISSEKNRKQFEFARALENPDLIEVKKPKKYYVHLFKSNSKGYLNKNKEVGYYILGSKRPTSYYQTQFTKDEIAKIPQDAFKITDKALEEVEEDE